MNVEDFEFGLDTFVIPSLGPDGLEESGDVTIRNTVEEAVLADRVGIDSYNIAEHYRADFMDSASHVILAAIAGRTTQIRLGTAVTVLSTQDPVRIYNQFATLDAVSNGRAQLIVGRGSLTESFPLFGFDLAEYEELFEEKLDLLMKLLREQPVTWSGKYRPAMTNQYLTPPLPEGHIPTWVGVGGSPQSVIRAARFGLPLMLAVIGGKPERFAPYVDLYRRALDQFGFSPRPIGMHSHGFVAQSDDEAIKMQYPHWEYTHQRMSEERGWKRPSFEQFQYEREQGALYLGSPETVAQKMAKMIQALGLSRFDFTYAMGRSTPEDRLMTVELFGHEVIPRVKELLSGANYDPESVVLDSSLLKAR
jgi:probable LLM family oxidoreductase